MTSRYDYALQWRWVSIGQKKSHALEFLKLGMSEFSLSLKMLTHLVLLPMLKYGTFFEKR
jgi:hypothetical protein